MKRTLFLVPVLAAVIMAGNFIQSPDGVTGATRRGAMPAGMALKSFSGVVLSVEDGDLSSGIRQTVVLASRSGEQMTMIITTTTRVYDKNQSNPLSAHVVKNDPVFVKFTTNAYGINVASEVTVTE